MNRSVGEGINEIETPIEGRLRIDESWDELLASLLFAPRLYASKLLEVDDS